MKTPTHIASWTTLVFAILSATSTPAQDTATASTLRLSIESTAASSRGGDHHQDKFIDLIKGDHGPQELIAALATLTSTNILINPRDLSQEQLADITLQTTTRLTPSDAWTVVENILFARDLVIVPLNSKQKIYELVSLRGQHRNRFWTQAVMMTPDEVLTQRGRKIAVQCVLLLDYVRANTATNTLRPFFHYSSDFPSITIGNFGNEQSLVLSGIAHNVATAIELIRTADVPQKPAPVAEADPKAATTIKALLQQLEALTARVQALEGK